MGQDRVGPSIKIWQAGAIVVSAGQTAVASRGRWVSRGASGGDQREPESCTLSLIR